MDNFHQRFCLGVVVVPQLNHLNLLFFQLLQETLHFLVFSAYACLLLLALVLCHEIFVFVLLILQLIFLHLLLQTSHLSLIVFHIIIQHLYLQFFLVAHQCVCLPLLLFILTAK